LPKTNRQSNEPDHQSDGPVLLFFKSPQQPAKAGVEDFFQLFIALAWLVDAVFGKPWWLDHK
jgi:hypothetical protein